MDRLVSSQTLPSFADSASQTRRSCNSFITKVGSPFNPSWALAFNIFPALRAFALDTCTPFHTETQCELFYNQSTTSYFTSHPTSRKPSRLERHGQDSFASRRDRVCWLFKPLMGFPPRSESKTRPLRWESHDHIYLCTPKGA